MTQLTHSHHRCHTIPTLSIDGTRAEIPTVMKELGYSLSEIRAYFDWRRDAATMRAMEQKFNEEAWKGITMLCFTIYGSLVHSAYSQSVCPLLQSTATPNIQYG